MVLTFFNSFSFSVFAIVYLVLISLISLIFFSLDKFKAKKNKRRIPEATLHILELLGGVFIIIPSMYVIRHKNRKWKYFLWSYLILIVWLAVIFLITQQVF